MTKAWEQIVSPQVARILQGLPTKLQAEMTEIRLRAGQPLRLMLAGRDVMISTTGQPVEYAGQAYICRTEDVRQTVHILCQHSLYAFNQQLRCGYVTIAGGHRVGLCGQTILTEGKITTLTEFSSLNIRLAREVRGCADPLLPYVVHPAGVYSTLIISPPRCGKTTVLRDLVRQLSTGCSRLSFRGVAVGVVDERSELAACYQGQATLDVGERTDVLDACPKAEGMQMLLRTMAPSVIVTDELGREDDAAAVWEALHAGVKVIAAVHGRDEQEVAARPYIGRLLAERVFERYVILGNQPALASLQKVVQAATGDCLYERRE